MTPSNLAHRLAISQFSRRTSLQAGALGLMGLGLGDVSAARAGDTGLPVVPKRSVVFVFLNGGIAHQDSFDLKPDAPDGVRGEFQPISTDTPGIQICEHLPRLARQTHQYTLVRSVTTDSSDHGTACHKIFTGRLDIPPGENFSQPPSPNEWPSFAAQMTYATRSRTGLPPAAVLPQPSINEANAVRPGQYAGKLGSSYEAWHLPVAAPCPLGNGACPHCFRFEGTPYDHQSPTIFEIPMLSLPDGGPSRLDRRIALLDHIDQQRRTLAVGAESARLDRHRQQALSVLSDPKVRAAFDVENADPKILSQYGKNKFGLSLLMARRLVDAGVNMVQVNLGKNSSWDTHRRNFPNMKSNLLPYLDQSLSAFLNDLHESGLIDSTLVVVSGEFGRTPRINPDGGRDHWGPVMTSLFAGSGIPGGQVIGATDALAAYPISGACTIENLAATMLNALDIPRHALWMDVDGRPHEFYRAEPIAFA